MPDGKRLAYFELDPATAFSPLDRGAIKRREQRHICRRGDRPFHTIFDADGPAFGEEAAAKLGPQRLLNESMDALTVIVMTSYEKHIVADQRVWRETKVTVDNIRWASYWNRI